MQVLTCLLCSLLLAVYMDTHNNQKSFILVVMQTLDVGERQVYVITTYSNTGAF